MEKINRNCEGIHLSSVFFLFYVYEYKIFTYIFTSCKYKDLEPKYLNEIIKVVD